MKDTKLISKNLSLITKEGDINARKLRNDICRLETSKSGSIRIGSYLESGDLRIKVE
jgi:hypothetical protein